MKGVVNLGYGDASPASAVVELVADAGGRPELVVDVRGRPEMVVDVRGRSVGELERVDEGNGLGGSVVAAVVKVDSLASLVEQQQAVQRGLYLSVFESGCVDSSGQPLGRSQAGSKQQPAKPLVPQL
ncbi:MAG: hypothetical protein L6R37_005320 [Teloschistes peruensis]|nr:MAG: hypothetical protein L6R37_005320 [Teloschistes peruensis]